MKFATWSGLDEASGRPDDGDALSGRLVDYLKRQALERGHELADFEDHDMWLAANGPAPLGDHLVVADEERVWFHVQLVDTEGSHIVWRVSETKRDVGWNRREGLGSLESEFDAFLAYAETATAGDSSSTRGGDVGPAIEQFVYRWQAVAGEVAWSSSERLVGDALVAMLAEVGKSETPPRGVIRSAMEWFKPRIDTFGDEFAKAAGKTAGAGAVAGAAYAATHVPYLKDALSQIMRWLDGS